MSNVNIPAHSVKSIVFVGVKALRSAFKLLSKVAGPAVMDSPQSRTFLRADETSTWFGASHAYVTLMTRVRSQSSIDTPPGEHVHDVPFARFKRIAELVTCDTIGVELSEDNNVLGVSALDQKGGLNATFKLASTPEPSAPSIPTMEPFPYSEAWGVDSLEMVRAIDQCIPSMGKSTRWEDGGIFIECGDDGVTLLATDRAKITRARMDASTEGFRPSKPMMIPRSGLKALSAFLANLDGSTARFAFESQPAKHCGIDITAQFVRFRSDNLDLRIRLDDNASLPKFSEENIFSAPAVASITICDVKAFTKAVKAASHDGSVELSYDGERVLVSSGDGTETEVFPGRGNHSGEAFARSLDGKALLAYLKSQAKSDRLTFGIAGHAERKGTSDGKTWDKFGPVSIVAENGSQFVMQPIDVEVIGAAPMVVEPEPVAEAAPEPVCDVEPTPTVETIVPAVEPVREPVKPLPAWADHVRINSYGRVTDYKRIGRSWHPSGNRFAPYMAIESQAAIEAMMATGNPLIVTPEPVEASPEPVATVDRAWNEVKPGDRIVAPDGSTVFVNGISPSWDGINVNIHRAGGRDLLARMDTVFRVVVEASPEPVVMERTIVRSAACSPEPTGPEVKPLTPVPGFSGSPSVERANAVYTPEPTPVGMPLVLWRAIQDMRADDIPAVGRALAAASSEEWCELRDYCKAMDNPATHPFRGCGYFMMLVRACAFGQTTERGPMMPRPDGPRPSATPVPDFSGLTPVPGFSELAPISGGSPEEDRVWVESDGYDYSNGDFDFGQHIASEVKRGLPDHVNIVIVPKAESLRPRIMFRNPETSAPYPVALPRETPQEYARRMLGPVYLEQVGRLVGTSYYAAMPLPPLSGGSPELDAPPVPVFPDDEWDNGDRPDDDHDTPSSWDGIPEPFDPDSTVLDIPVTPEDHEADEWALYDACESMIVAGSRRSRLAHVEDALRTILLHILETEVRIGQAARVTWNHRMSAERREDFLEWIGSNGILIDPNGDAPTDPAEMFEWLCVECRDGSTVDFPEPTPTPDPDGGDDGDEAIGPGGRRECGRRQYPQAPIDLGRHHDAAHDQATRAMERGAKGAGLGAPDHDRQRPPALGPAGHDNASLTPDTLPPLPGFSGGDDEPQDHPSVPVLLVPDRSALGSDGHRVGPRDLDRHGERGEGLVLPGGLERGMGGPGRDAGVGVAGSPEATPWPDTLTIQGRLYGLARAPGGWDVCRTDGVAYRVTQGPLGLECECPAFFFACRGVHGAECRHIRGLKEAGLLPQAQPVPPLPGPVPEFFRNPCPAYIDAAAL